MHPRFVPQVMAAVSGLFVASQASAVVLYATNQRNTLPPGSLASGGTSYTPGGADDPRRLLNSGWQWQGIFGEYVGIPIAPQYFVTAAHAGATSGTVSVNGTVYNVDSNFNNPGVQWWVNDPNSDLRIFKITGAFASYAPLDTTNAATAGKPVVVFGRGTQRGAEVRVGGELKGWVEGPLDGVLSWGENVIAGYTNFGPGFGSALRFNFDRDGVANEGQLTDHDSAGGVFVSDNGVWKLAGINLARSSPFGYTDTDPAFNASIFDAGGLWYRAGGAQFIEDTDADVPASSYSTRIFPNVTWINSVIGGSFSAPEPGSATLLGMICGAALLRRQRRATC